MNPSFIDYDDVETLMYLYSRGILTEANLRDIEERCVKPPLPSDLIGVYLEGSVHPFDVMKAHFHAAYEVGALTECVTQAREFAVIGLPHPLNGTRSDWEVFVKVFEEAEMIAEDIIYTLQNVINNRLPSGLWFGVHPYDGACIGIWCFSEEV